MKKLFALILASVLLLSVPVALGEEGNQYTNWTDNPESTVTMTVSRADSSFVVIIPATLEVDAKTMSGSMTVTLQGGYRLFGSLNVCLSSSANNMKLVEAGGLSVAYTLQINGVDWTGNVTPIVSASAGTSANSKTGTISVEVTECPNATGTYTDTLTFILK